MKITKKEQRKSLLDGHPFSKHSEGERRMEFKSDSFRMQMRYRERYKRPAHDRENKRGKKCNSGEERS